MRVYVALGALVGIVLLGGCSGGSSGGSSGGGVPQQDAKVPGVAYGAANRLSEASGTTAPTATTTDLVESRALIRIAELAVSVARGHVDAQADHASDIATLVGGEVYSDNRSTGSASLTLKVPPDSLASVLGKLSALGTERSRSVSTQDVTGKVADVDARLQSARDSIVRLRTLYAGASKVADVIAIESELATRESDLESLEAQQRALDAQTSMATVHLELTAIAPPPPVKHHATPRHGVGGALAAGWDHFTAAAAWIARAVATALPFLVLLALFAGTGTLLWRRRPAPPPQPDAS